MPIFKARKIFVVPAVVFCLLLFVVCCLFRQGTVPIILYHQIGDTALIKGHVVSVDSFRKQLEYLNKNGYQVLPLAEYVQGIKADRKFSRKSVVLTFDDGKEDNFTNAFPLLLKYRFPASFFVSTSLIGKEGYMTWDQIKTMEAAGMDFQSHTLNHGYLLNMSEKDRRYAISESKKVLEAKTGRVVDYFAYPIGGFNDEIIQEVKDAGYHAALTTNRGRDKFNKRLYELNRIKLKDTDTLEFVLWVKLSGYYNILRIPKKLGD